MWLNVRHLHRIVYCGPISSEIFWFICIDIMNCTDTRSKAHLHRFCHQTLSKYISGGLDIYSTPQYRKLDSVSRGAWHNAWLYADEATRTLAVSHHLRRLLACRKEQVNFFLDKLRRLNIIKAHLLAPQIHRPVSPRQGGDVSGT